MNEFEAQKQRKKPLAYCFLSLFTVCLFAGSVARPALGQAPENAIPKEILTLMQVDEAFGDGGERSCTIGCPSVCWTDSCYISYASYPYCTGGISYLDASICPVCSPPSSRKYHVFRVSAIDENGGIFTYCDTTGIPDEVPCNALYLIPGDVRVDSYTPCTAGPRIGRIYEDPTAPFELRRCLPATFSGSLPTYGRRCYPYVYGEQPCCPDFDGDGHLPASPVWCNAPEPPYVGPSYPCHEGDDFNDTDPAIWDSRIGCLIERSPFRYIHGLSVCNGWSLSSPGIGSSEENFDDHLVIGGVDVFRGARHGQPLELDAVVKLSQHECLPPVFSHARLNVMAGNFALESLRFNANPALDVPVPFYFPQARYTVPGGVVYIGTDGFLMDNIPAQYVGLPEGFLANYQLGRNGTYSSARYFWIVDLRDPARLKLFNHALGLSFDLEFFTSRIGCEDPEFTVDTWRIFRQSGLICPSEESKDFNPLGAYNRYSSYFGRAPLIPEQRFTATGYVGGTLEPGLYLPVKAEKILSESDGSIAPRKYTVRFDWEPNRSSANPKLRSATLEYDGQELETLTFDYHEDELERALETSLRLKSVTSSVDSNRDLYINDEDYDIIPVEVGFADGQRVSQYHKLLRAARIGAAASREGLAFDYQEINLPYELDPSRMVTRSVSTLQGKTLLTYGHSIIRDSEYGQEWAYTSITGSSGRQVTLNYSGNSQLYSRSDPELVVTDSLAGSYNYSLRNGWIRRIERPGCSVPLYESTLVQIGRARRLDIVREAYDCGSAPIETDYDYDDIGRLTSIKRNGIEIYTAEDYERKEVVLDEGILRRFVPTLTRVDRAEIRCELEDDGRPEYCEVPEKRLDFDYGTNQITIRSPSAAGGTRTDIIQYNASGNIELATLASGTTAAVTIDPEYVNPNSARLHSVTDGVRTEEYGWLNGRLQTIEKSVAGGSSELTLLIPKAEDPGLLNTMATLSLDDGASRWEVMRFDYQNDTLARINVHSSDAPQNKALYEVTNWGNFSRPREVKVLGITEPYTFDYYGAEGGVSQGLLRSVTFGDSTEEYYYDLAGVKRTDLTTRLPRENGSLFPMICVDALSRSIHGVNSITSQCGEGPLTETQVISRDSRQRPVGVLTTENGVTVSNVTLEYHPRLGVADSFSDSVTQRRFSLWFTDTSAPYDRLTGAALSNTVTGETIWSENVSNWDALYRPRQVTENAFGELPSTFSLTYKRTGQPWRVDDESGKRFEFAYSSSLGGELSSITHKSIYGEMFGVARFSNTFNAAGRSVDTVTTENYKSDGAPDSRFTRSTTVERGAYGYEKVSSGPCFCEISAYEEGQPRTVTSRCDGENDISDRFEYDQYGNLASGYRNGTPVFLNESNSLGVAYTSSDSRGNETRFFYTPQGGGGVVSPGGEITRMSRSIDGGYGKVVTVSETQLPDSGERIQEIVESHLSGNAAQKTATVLSGTGEEVSRNVTSVEGRNGKATLLNKESSLQTPQGLERDTSRVSFDYTVSTGAARRVETHESSLQRPGQTGSDTMHHTVEELTSRSGATESVRLTYPSGKYVTYHYDKRRELPLSIEDGQGGQTRVLQQYRYDRTIPLEERLFGLSTGSYFATRSYERGDERWPWAVTGLRQQIRVNDSQNLEFLSTTALDGRRRARELQTNGAGDYPFTQQRSQTFNPFGLNIISGLLQQGGGLSMAWTKVLNVGPEGEVRGAALCGRDGNNTQCVACQYNSSMECANVFEYSPLSQARADLLDDDGVRLSWRGAALSHVSSLQTAQRKKISLGYGAGGIDYIEEQTPRGATTVRRLMSGADGKPLTIGYTVCSAAQIGCPQGGSE